MLALGREVTNTSLDLYRPSSNDTQFGDKSTNINLPDQIISFEEFSKIVRKKYKNGLRDHHWRSIFEDCDPCTMKYDFVLRLETLKKDYRILASYILRPRWLRESVPHLSQMKSGLSDPDANTLDGLWRFQEVDIKVLETLKVLYDNDLQLFGYSWDGDNGAKCKIPVDGNAYCC